MNGLLADCHPLSIYLDSVFGLSQNPDLATIGNRSFPLENPLSLIFALGLHHFSQTIHPNVFCTKPPNITWNDILESPPPPQDTISVMYRQLFGTENMDLLSVFLPSGPSITCCPLEAVLYWHKLSIAAQAQALWMRARDFLEQACTIDNLGTNVPSNASI